MRKNFNLVIPYIIFFIFVVLSSYKLLFTTGYHLGVDYIYLDATNFLKQYLSAWNPYYFLGQPNYGNPMNFGITNVSTFYFVVFHAIFNFLFRRVASSIFLLFNYICPFFGFLYFSSYIYRDEKFNKEISLYAALLYQFSFFILWYQRSGPLGIFFGLFPILLRNYFEFREENNIQRRTGLFLLLIVILSFLISMWAAWTVQFFIFMGLYELFQFITSRRVKIFIKNIFALISLGAITIFVNPQTFFLFKFYPYNMPVNKLLSKASLLQLYYCLNNTLIHKVIFLYSDYGYIYFIFAIFGAYLFRKHRHKCLISLWLIGIFFAKGVAPPFSKFSEILYSKVPLFYFFRNPNKFMAFVILVTCTFIGSFIGKAIFPLLNSHRKTFIFNLVFSLVIIFLNPSLLRGDLGGFFSIVYNSPHLEQIDRYLQWTDQDKRFLYLPELQGMQNYNWVKPHSYFSLIQPYWGHRPCIRPMSNSSLFPIDYSNQFLTYVNNVNPRNALFSKLLEKTVTDNVIIDKTFQKNTDSYKEAEQFNESLSNNLYFKKVVDTYNMAIYKNKEDNISPLLFYDGLCYAVAPFSIYEALSKVSLLSVKNPIIFWHQNARSSLPIYSQKTLLLFYNKTDLDMLGEKLIINFSIPLAPFTRRGRNLEKGYPYLNGWAPFGRRYTPHGAYEIRPYLKKGVSFISSSPIATSKPDVINVPLNIDLDDSYHFLIRILFSPNRKKLRFYLDNKKLTTVDVGTENYLGLNWIELPVQKLKKGEHTLSIESIFFTSFPLYPIILDGLIVVNDKMYQEIKKEITSWKDKTTYFYIYSADFLDIFEKLLKFSDNKYVLHLNNDYEKKISVKKMLKNKNIWDKDSLFIISEDKKNKSQIVNYLNQNLPLKNLSYKRISFTHYLIKNVSNSKGIIIFRSTFNSNWRLEKIFRPTFIIDGYATGFWFSEEFSNRELNLQFIPERDYRLLILISTLMQSLFLVFSMFLLKGHNNWNR